MSVNDPGSFRIRPIRTGDAAAVARIIRTVMPEFGADGPGFAIHDREVDEMPSAYARPGHAYFVVEREGDVLGGGGLGPLTPEDRVTCELRKMYFLKDARGLGLGAQLLHRCISTAQTFGYRRMYLETLSSMVGAQKLYRRLGFEPLCAPEGNTGHFSCDTYYARALQPAPLFHITARDDWSAASARGEYAPQGLEREGFIHLSTAEQVLGSAERHFAGRDDLVVLTVRGELLTSPLRMEEARGELFPHLYGPLNLDAVTGTLPLLRRSDGRFELPGLSGSAH